MLQATIDKLGALSTSGAGRVPDSDDVASSSSISSSVGNSRCTATAAAAAARRVRGAGTAADRPPRRQLPDPMIVAIVIIDVIRCLVRV